MSGNQFVQREKRFEVGSTKDFDIVVSRGESDETVYFADLMDFSRSGLKFCVPFNARFDEKLRIRLTFKNSELQYVGMGRVRHIRNSDSNRWVVGCSIEPTLSDELINFLASATQQERRKNSRVEVEANGFLSRQGKIEETPASIRNLSKGGFCLLVDEAPEIGSQVNFTIENRFGFEEQIDARIRWQKTDEGGFLVGLSFVDNDSYDRLVNCLDLPTTKKEIDLDLLDWKLVVCAMIAMLMPSVSYVLLGASLTSSNPDVSQAVSPRRVEVQKVANPKEIKPREIVKKPRFETLQSKPTKVEQKETQHKTVKPNKKSTGKPKQKDAPKPSKRSSSVKKPTKTNRQASSKPPIELTSVNHAKPRRLRVTASSGPKKTPTTAKASKTSKIKSRRTFSTKRNTSTTRRSKNNGGIDIPSESIPDGLPM